MLGDLRSALWNAGAAIFYIGLGGYLLLTALKLGAQQRHADGSQTSRDLLGLCEYTTVRELASPDGGKTVTLGYSDCGATTNWQSGIAITDARTGKTYRGQFGLDGKAEGLQLRWQNGHTLVLSDFPIEKLRWFKQDDLSGVALVLKP